MSKNTTVSIAEPELVNVILSSKVNNSLIETTTKIIDDHYKFEYDFSVSKEEAKEFLEKFKKDFNQASFDKLVADCKKDVINSIVTPFGLGHIVAAYDKVGGNVTTTHNFEKGIVATADDKARHNEWQNSINNAVDRKEHDKIKNQWVKKQYQEMTQGGEVIDGYSGKVLGSKDNNGIEKYNAIHGEHITAVEKIEKDSKNHLFADGDNKAKRLKDRAKLSGDKNNLTLIDGGMNSSKSDSDLLKWANAPVSKKHAKEAGNPNMTNAEYYGLDEAKINEAYKKSKDHIKRTQLKKQVIKQGKELVSTGASEGAKMGAQQAMGFVMTEFFAALFDEILDIYKNGFSKGFDDDRFLSVLKERLKKIATRLKKKWKDTAMAFKDGFISGFISNLATTAINMFVTTGKRLVRIIREGIFSLFKAIKMIIFPPKDMTSEEAMHEAKKLIAAGLIVSLGVLIEEAVSQLIKSIVAISPFADVLTAVLVGAVTGLAITMTAYYIDKRKNDKEAMQEMMRQANEKFDNAEHLLQRLAYNYDI